MPSPLEMTALLTRLAATGHMAAPAATPALSAGIPLLEGLKTASPYLAKVAPMIGKGLVGASPLGMAANLLTSVPSSYGDPRATDQILSKQSAGASPAARVGKAFDTFRYYPDQPNPSAPPPNQNWDEALSNNAPVDPNARGPKGTPTPGWNDQYGQPNPNGNPVGPGGLTNYVDMGAASRNAPAPFDLSSIPGYNPAAENMADPAQLENPQGLKARLVMDPATGRYVNDYYRA